MRLKHLIVAAAALSATALASGSQAAPYAPDTSAASGLDVLKVHSTCHANTRRHYDPDFGGPVDHHHRQSDCRVIYDEEEEEEDCHSSPQSHRLQGYGRRPVLHRHRGSSCRVVILEEEDEDCHRSPQQHRVPGLGRVWHRHIGASCRVEELEVYQPGQSTRGCIQVGPVRVCP